MKLLTTLAAVAAVGLMLVPEDANAQRRVGYRVGGVGWRAAAVGWRAPRLYGGVYRSYAAYRPWAYSYAAYRPYWGYSYAAYRPYRGWGVGAAYASYGAAYNTVAWSPYYDYAAYGYYPTAYASCGYAWTWMPTRWGYQRAWASGC